MRLRTVEEMCDGFACLESSRGLGSLIHFNPPINGALIVEHEFLTHEIRIWLMIFNVVLNDWIYGDYFLGWTAGSEELEFPPYL